MATFGNFEDSLVAQKIGLLRKSFRIFGDHNILLRCLNSFILPCLECCSPVWSSVADSEAPAVGAIINSSFDDGHSVASEIHGLIRPYLKKIGLDVNDLSNYRPVTNLTHLSKIIERSMRDHLVPFLEKVGMVPHYQSAYRKLHSTDCIMQNT